MSGIQFRRSFTPSRPLGTSCCGVCFGGFCVLLFLGFGCFVWLALHYPRFASESWVLCHADALFQISHCQVVRGPTVSETYTAVEKKGNGKLIF